MEFNRFDVSTKERIWHGPAACLDRWGIGPPGTVAINEATHLLERVQNMQESTTYQAILKEGRNERRIAREKQLLIRLGTKRFGKPDHSTLDAIQVIPDIERLEALGDRIVDPDIRDWNSVLTAR